MLYHRVCGIDVYDVHELNEGASLEYDVLMQMMCVDAIDCN